MNRKYLIVAIILFSGICNIFGQMPDPLPVTISLDKAGYYQHGYNSANTGAPDSPREDRDSVMVGASMNYFVAPDRFYNSAYYAQSAYTNTILTKSKFTWTIPNGTISYQNQNATSTSPYVTITWTGPSASPSTDTIRVVETPVEYNGFVLPVGSICPGAEVKIPVTVIPKPSVMFGVVSGTRESSECADFDPGQADGAGNIYPVFNFPIVPVSAGNISEADGVVITYTITKDNDTEGPELTKKITGAKTNSMNLPVKFSDFGKYVVTIKSITDRIAQKCNITTDNVSTTQTDNQFTYYVLPQPNAGKTYHIPNNL